MDTRELFDGGLNHSRIGNKKEKEGYMREARKYWKSALHTYTECCKLEPEKAFYWNSVGWMYFKLGDPEKGIHYLENAIKLDPKYGQPWINIGLIRRSLKDYKGALEAFEKACELTPLNAWTWYSAGIIHYIFGNMEKAVNYSKKANEILPQKSIKRQFNHVVGRWSKRPPDELRYKIPKRMKVLLEKNVPELCLYCGAGVASGQDKQSMLSHELGKLVWETNNKLPEKAETDEPAFKSKGPGYKPYWVKNGYGGVETKYEKAMITYRSPIMKEVEPLFLGEFLTLKGTICSICAEEFIKGANKCFKKVKKSNKFYANKFSKIDKSMDDCFNEYVRIMNAWLDKVN